MKTIIAPPKLSAQIGIRRASEKRTDTAFLSAARDSADARVLGLFDLKVPIIPSEDGSTARIRWLTFHAVGTIAKPVDVVFLGESDAGAPLFACNFSPLQLSRAPAIAEAMKPLVDLRSLAIQGVLSEGELLLVSQVRSLMTWHAVNRCCARCGGLMRFADGGWRKHCGACGQDAYPRMDPAVIMLITKGGRCLLGHEHRFPEKMYSTLAGYVEPGDDIEHAVRREIKEEAGIDVGEVRYVASQPWPFPHSLMIGCWGEALNEELTLDKTEIADARWFSKDEAQAMLEGRHKDGLFAPPSISMAHTLIKGFVDGALG
jgi:NAD+ diphosphatase